jgi:predicted helicase
VVNFIVCAIDDILKDRKIFDIKSGLADHNRVTVLDFACGTGTFLVEVFERIFENIGGPKSAKADLVVREHMLKNIFGFEYLIAPYTIAHLKLSQYLADRGHALSEAERLLIYLTNTLEPIEPQKTFLLPELTREVEAAQKVKEQPILVITGNPLTRATPETWGRSREHRSTPTRPWTASRSARKIRSGFKTTM